MRLQFSHLSACLWLLPPCNRRCGRLARCWPDGCSETSPAGLIGSRVKPKISAAKTSSAVSEFSDHEDTGVDICSDDVARHVKVELDEFPLRTEERRAAAMTAGKISASVTDD